MPRKSIFALTLTESPRGIQTKSQIFQDNRKILINELFDMWDLDGDNRVKSNEVRPMLSAMGREVTNEEIMDFLKIADRENSGLVDKIQFMEAIEKIYSLPNDAVDEVKNAFSLFDPNETGKITTKAFKDILLQYGDFNQDNVDSIIKIADPDEVGYIDFENFVDTWKFQ